MAPGEAELRLRERLGRLRNLPLLGGTRLSAEVERLEKQLARLEAEPTDDEIWRSVELSRHPERPYTLDYVERLLEDWVELHGDRGRADDPAIVTGLGRLDGRTVALVGHQKGRDEQHGQGGAIARSQAAMARLGVPTVACIIGEGGSGGAIALALSDRVLMQENAIYSVITPEGCAAILWRDAGEKQKAAAAFKPDAAHCLELGVVDAIVPEPPGGAQTDPAAAATLLGESIGEALEELEGVPGDELRRRRRARFRSIGVYA
ncbi:MAG: acetyl-CoA carboxylase carboxyl transferase subunit alpha [Actinobacteria bacterium]|nr:MAG: acetyl-CoA carboxylase carboxyl transferase subunit alpha [Actinomycetota bacterium]